MTEIAPSLLAADPLRLYDEIARARNAGVVMLHVDVMDAHFVPNLAFPPATCVAIHRAFPDMTLDVHLMMDHAMDYAETFIKAGAARLTVHIETVADPVTTMRRIRALGARAGLSLKPKTPIEDLFPALHEMDQALIMTVEPGFGGQKLMPEQLDKIKTLRAMGYRGDIAVDGGVTIENMGDVRNAGATTLIMGTAFFRAADQAAQNDLYVGDEELSPTPFACNFVTQGHACFLHHN